MSNYYIDDNGKMVTDSGIDSDVDVMDKPRDTGDADYGTRVILYDDNYHSFHEVVEQLKLAIKCSDKVGFYHAHTVHTKGKSLVYSGEPEDCKETATILRAINLTVKIEE